MNYNGTGILEKKTFPQSPVYNVYLLNLSLLLELNATVVPSTDRFERGRWPPANTNAAFCGVE